MENMIQILLIMMAVNVILLIWLFMEFYAFKMGVDKNFEFLTELCSKASTNKCMLSDISTNPMPYNGSVMCTQNNTNIGFENENGDVDNQKERRYNPDEIEGIFDSFFEEILKKEKR